jgi:hypothetical protein
MVVVFGGFEEVVLLCGHEIGRWWVALVNAIFHRVIMVKLISTAGNA